MAKSFLPTRRNQIAGEPYFEDAEFGAAYPALYELLASSQGPDGKCRLGASLSLFAEDGRLKVCVNDRTSGLVWFCTLESARGILEQVETLLQKEAGQWRLKRAR